MLCVEIHVKVGQECESYWLVKLKYAFPRVTLYKVGTRKDKEHSLLEYCKLDTLAMMRVLEKLREVY